jgi:hypothetical protein
MNQLDLLDAWERGAPLDPTGRAVALLAATASSTVEDVAALPVGVRDGLLLDLHASLFGPELAAVVGCPACGERLELAFAVDQVRAEPPRPVEVLHIEGYEVSVRPPDSRDLAAVVGLDPATAETVLLRRCVSGDVDRLPPSVVAAVEDAILAADPQADVRIALTCEPCGHQWHATLDIGAFVWARLEGWARRCALEVHALARAYGWREADILAMSPWRRGLYLELVSS